MGGKNKNKGQQVSSDKQWHAPMVLPEERRLAGADGSGYAGWYVPGMMQQDSGAANSNMLFPNDHMVDHEPKAHDIFIDEIVGEETHTHYVNGKDADTDALTKNIKLAFEAMHKHIDKRIDKIQKLGHYNWDGNTSNNDPMPAPEHTYGEVTATYSKEVTANTKKEHIPRSSKTRMREFIISHPFVAMAIGKPEDKSVNISNTTVRFAEAYQNENPSDFILKENKYGEVPKGAENRGSEVNAFRHALWITTITNKYGSGIAKEVGDAHEDNPWADLTKRNFTGENKYNDADQVVDLLNNKIAREELAVNNPNDNSQQLAGKVMDYFYRQGLWTYHINPDGSVAVQRTKITSDQYDLMKTAIKNRNEYGYTKQEWDERMREGEKEAEKERREMLREPKF